MKNLKIFLFFLSVPFLSNAQSNWSLGVIGGVDFSNIRYTKNVEGDYATPLESLLAIRYGLNIGHTINPKWSIRSGLRVNSQGYKRTERSLNLSNPNDPAFDGFVDKHSHSFLEIPLHIRYHFKDNKTQWYIIGGISPNIYLNSKTKFTFDEITEKDKFRIDDPLFNKFTVSADFGLGFQRSISNSIKIYFQPNVRYYIPGVFQHDEPGPIPHFYNIGLEVGCSFELGK